MQSSFEHASVSASALLKAAGIRTGRTLCPCCQPNKLMLRKAVRKGRNVKPKYKDQRNENKSRFYAFNC
jgi:hypothetical protein